MHDTEKSILVIVFVCAVLYLSSSFPAIAPLRATFTYAIEIGGGLVAFLLLVAFLRYSLRPKHVIRRPTQQYSASQRDPHRPYMTDADREWFREM